RTRQEHGKPSLDHGGEGWNRLRNRVGNHHILERQQIHTLGDHPRNPFVDLRRVLRDQDGACGLRFRTYFAGDATGGGRRVPLVTASRMSSMAVATSWGSSSWIACPLDAARMKRE